QPGHATIAGRVGVPHNVGFTFFARGLGVFAMNKVVIGVLAVIGVAVAAGAGYWMGARQPGASTPSAAGAPAGKGQGGNAAGANAQGQPINVEAVKVSTTALPQVITAVGSLRSDESVVVRPEVAGRVSQILFKEGQRVTKGTPLVRLDTAINDADVKQARANYTLAKSKY